MQHERMLYSMNVQMTASQLRSALQTVKRFSRSAPAAKAVHPALTQGYSTLPSLKPRSKDNLDHVSRPEGLDQLHAEGIDGRGVTVAVIDSGVARHEDFGDRIKAFKDFGSKRRAPFDPRGHGTHVAGIILGDGEKIDGIAPKADLVSCRVASPNEAVEALDWVIANREKYSIDVVNLSLGAPANPDPEKDELRKAAERAVAAGLIVVASAGNECTGDSCQATITSPGNSPDVITVGALDDHGTSKRADDNIWKMSSQGAKGSGKPDLVAEGVNVVSVLAPKSDYAERAGHDAHYVSASGSSQATSMVTGAVTLLMQANPSLSNAEVKEILLKTADPVKGASKASQGAGRLDLREAIEVAQAKRSA